MVYYIEQIYINYNYFHSDELIYIFELINIISNKYIIILLLITIYLSSNNINERYIYSSFASDNFNDIWLKSLSKFILKQSKISLHIINNKLLHPIAMFLQNL